MVDEPMEEMEFTESSYYGPSGPVPAQAFVDISNKPPNQFLKASVNSKGSKMSVSTMIHSTSIR